MITLLAHLNSFISSSFLAQLILYICYILAIIYMRYLYSKTTSFIKTKTSSTLCFTGLQPLQLWTMNKWTQCETNVECVVFILNYNMVPNCMCKLNITRRILHLNLIAWPFKTEFFIFPLPFSVGRFQGFMRILWTNAIALHSNYLVFNLQENVKITQNNNILKKKIFFFKKIIISK